MDPQTELRSLFYKLDSWREVSQRQFSNIINSYNSSITKGVNDLVEEVCNLKTELSAITEERNDLIHSVNNLSDEIKKFKNNLPKVHSSPDHEKNNGTPEVGSSKVEVMDIKEDAEGTTYNYLDGQAEHIAYGSFQHEDSFPDTVPEEQNRRTEIVDQEECIYYRAIPDSSGQQKKYILNDRAPINSPVVTDFADLVDPDDNVQNIRADQVHDIDYENEETEKSRKNKEESKKHIEGVNEKSRKHGCKECGYATFTKSTLMKHMKELHENPMDHISAEGGCATSQKGKLSKCDQCPYTTGHQQRLRLHIEGVHKKVMNHTCGECGYAASWKSNLKRHIQTKHRNNSCEECEYAVSGTGKLKRYRVCVHKTGKAK